MSRQVADQFVRRLLADPGGRYRRMDDRVDEFVPDLYYRYVLLDKTNSSRVSLLLFLRVGELGGTLWEQEMRIHERLSDMRHPALPTLLDGGWLDGPDGQPGAAYIRTEMKGRVGDDSRLPPLFRHRRGDALLHLWLLADALAVLADARIAHRHLWPGNLDVDTDERGGEVRSVRLARFAMSGLFSNIVRSGQDLSLRQVRDLYMQAPVGSRFYSPPERLRFLFQRPDAELGGPAGDVFALGMMAAEWLLGGPVGEGDPDSYDGVLRRQAATVSELERRRKDLPGPLASVLRDMLDRTPVNRPSAFEVSKIVAASYGDAQAVLAEDAPAEPYLVAYMPERCDTTLLPWGYISESAATEDGHDQLVDLIERDLRGAEVLFSPNGAEPLVSDGDPAKLRQAKVVIVGSQITWIADHLYIQEVGDPAPVDYGEIMVIRFVRRTEEIETQLAALRVRALPRRLPAVEAVAMPWEHEVAQLYAQGRPSWKGLVERVSSGRTTSEEEQNYLAAMDWFIRYQRAQFEARTYAFVRQPGQEPSQVLLRWDETTDRKRSLPDDALRRRAVLDAARLPMGVFVEESDEDDYGSRVVIAEGRDFFGALTLDVAGTIGTDVVVAHTDRPDALPERGWLRLASDQGTLPQIRNQADARVELESQRVLLQRLIQPKRRPLLGQQWEHAGGSLSGEGREAVKEMLRQGALFALQGPPGTGKTEVTSQAVADYVRARPEARVLVSAQSHDALENLAGRILEKLGLLPGSDGGGKLDRLALRVGRVPTGRTMDPRVARFLPGALVEGVVSYSRHRALEWISSRRSERPELLPVVEDWVKRLPAMSVELSRRAGAAANVVFATTGASTRRNLVENMTDEPFNWVLVEEAARAWPSELVLPLVRGLRWTLVGDHAQIGAYAKSDILAYLHACQYSEDEEIRAMYEARDAYADDFETFARIFRRPAASSPRRTLTEQYRMDAEISAMIGSAFYAETGGLIPARAPSPHPLTEPDVLLRSRLVWIDTGDAARCVEHWSNLHEAELCARLVRGLAPRPGSRSAPTLAVVTPYRAQVKLLRNRLGEHASRVHTVDAFQGREADVVVASLVRDKLGRRPEPRATVGHVATPARINVMLSRARELLVVVGRFQIYAEHAGKDWRKITDHFRQYGTIVPARDVMAS